MLRREFDALQDGDIVKLRGNTRQGPCVAFLPDKHQIQFAYEETNGHIGLSSMPYWALDFVSAHPSEIASSDPRDTTHRTVPRQRVRRD